MSFITECTLVADPSIEKDLLYDMENHFTYLGGIKKILDTEGYIGYVFDCNGDQPWNVRDSKDLKADYDKIIAMETNYGPESGIWTQVRRNGILEDTDETLVSFMKDMLEESVWQHFEKDASYTI